MLHVEFWRTFESAFFGGFWHFSYFIDQMAFFMQNKMS